MRKLGITQLRNYVYAFTSRLLNRSIILSQSKFMFILILILLSTCYQSPFCIVEYGKWDLALTEYSLTYCLLKVVKGQIVADFIVDHSVVETIEAYVGTKPWKLYFDGSKHKDDSKIGIYILSPWNIPIKFKYKIQRACSNNEVKYEALITCLQILLDWGAREVEIRGDFKLVIWKLKKEYKCIKHNLMLYFVRANHLLKRFDHVSVDHIPRLKNHEANDLA